MKNVVPWLGRNIDALIALLASLTIVTLSVFDVGNVNGSGVVSNATLAVLALLSGVLLRDRAQQENEQEELTKGFAAVSGALEHLPRQLTNSSRSGWYSTTFVTLSSGTRWSRWSPARV